MLENIYYRITGPEDAPRKWVFLHGLMGYSANWRKIIAAIEDQERVLVYDQRGHGRSFQPEEGYAPENYADDLKAILDELGWDQVVLVGHSMGGRNAMNFAHRFPERLSHLIIEDIGPELNSDGSKYHQLFESIPTPFPDKAKARDFLLKEWPEKMQGVWLDPAMLSQYLYSNIEQRDNGEADWRFSKKGILESVSAGRSQERWEEVKGLSIPSLWIRGSRSDELTEQSFQKIRELNPMIQGVEIADAGHWVHADQPEKFTQAIIDFVRSGNGF